MEGQILTKVYKDREVVSRVAIESARMGGALDGMDVSVKNSIKNNTLIVRHK